MAAGGGGAEERVQERGGHRLHGRLPGGAAAAEELHHLGHRVLRLHHERQSPPVLRPLLPGAGLALHVSS